MMSSTLQFCVKGGNERDNKLKLCLDNKYSFPSISSNVSYHMHHHTTRWVSREFSTPSTLNSQPAMLRMNANANIAKRTTQSEPK